MARIALYREWRPQRFADVVGQQHVVRTLLNGLRGDRLTHAYLFCGPRGTGKTSVARLVARAVNCLDSPAGEPCNECTACRGILSGSSLDVAEIDAASNRGIGEIRELRDRVRYAPTDVETKVYVIDEVHMLTTEAFNALLKTLEEPPDHVLFIMATTEPHKVPLTILSRCQRFDFHRLTEESIAGRLQQAIADTDLDVDPSVFMFIARLADGSMRDALGLLDQAIAYSPGGVTEETVAMIAGTVSTAGLMSIAGAIAAGDPARCLDLMAGLMDEGADPAHLIRSLVVHFRDILLAGINSGALTGRFARDEIAQMAELYRGLGRESAIEILEIFAEAESSVKYAASPRVLLEVSLVRATARVETGGSSKGREPAPNQTSGREQSPPQVETSAQARAARPAVSKPEAGPPDPEEPPPHGEPPPTETEPQEGSVRSVADCWQEILHIARQSGDNMVRLNMLADVKIEEHPGGRVTIDPPSAGHEQLLTPDCIRVLEDAARTAMGGQVKFEIRTKQAEAARPRKRSSSATPTRPEQATGQSDCDDDWLQAEFGGMSVPRNQQ